MGGMSMEFIQYLGFELEQDLESDLDFCPME